MNLLRTNKLGAIILLGAFLALGLNGPAAADAQIQVENDGLTLSAFASSAGVVLSMNIRVIGPDGFVFEDRVEDSAIQWIPEGDLADGIYYWEAWTVTAERGAAVHEISLPQAMFPGDVQGQANHEIQAAAQAAPAEEIPVERFFAPEDKNVHIESGSFRVTDGWLEEVDDGFLGSVDNYKPNAAQRLIGGILDFLVPSARAQNFTDDVTVTKANPSVILDSSASVDPNWSMLGATSLWSFRDLQNANTVIGIVPGANANALRITDTGNVGLGTAAATEALHIADSNPRIRLQNLSDAQTWYVKNTNQGRFEISENSGNDNPFSIEAGAPATALYLRSDGNIGLGTDDPQRNLHIMGNHIRIEDSNSTWDLNPGSQGLWFNQANPTTFGVLKLQNDAPEDSIVAAGGGVGIGTSAPARALHVRRTNNTAEIMVEETGASSVQEMFSLVHNGHPKFRMTDTSQSSVSWEFRTAGVQGSNERFQINKIGSGAIEMLVRAGGNVTIAGSLTQGSSRTIKERITELDPEQILARLDALPVHEWSYQRSPKERHLGPMAEDFHNVFGLGGSDKHIAPGDLAGVALAAAKGLHERNVELEARIEKLEALLLTAKE